MSAGPQLTSLVVGVRLLEMAIYTDRTGYRRMDEASCQGLIAAHDGAPVPELPVRFAYNRRLLAVMCGSAFLHLARRSGYPDAAGEETLESTPGLAEVYQQTRSGGLSPATADGQWAFGLALVKAGAEL